MTLKERLEEYLEKHTDRHNTKWLSSRDKLLWSDILEATKFLPESAVPKQRCWHIINDVWSIPVCPVDHIPVRWWDNRYNIYSSLSAKSRCTETAKKCRATRKKTREALHGRPMSERALYRSEVMSFTKRE